MRRGTTTIVCSRLMRTLARTRAEHLPCRAPRGTVGLEDIVERADGTRRDALERRLDDVGDAVNARSPARNAVDCDLVRRVEDRRRGPARSEHIIGEREGTEAGEVGAPRTSARRSRARSSGGDAGIDPLGIARAPARSACACRDCRAARSPSRRRTPPSSGRRSAGGRAPRSRSGRASKSQRASITSRPLFIIVAESTEILRPMPSSGARTPASGVTARQLGERPRAERAAGRGQQDPADASRGELPCRPCGRHWKIALCSLSIGSSVAPRSRTAAMKTGPAMTSASLFASSIFLPARAAASVGAQPGGADDRGHHGVDVGVRRDASSASAPASTSVSQPSAESRRAQPARLRPVGEDREAGPVRTAQLEERRRPGRAPSARTRGTGRDGGRRRRACCARSSRSRRGSPAFCDRGHTMYTSAATGSTGGQRVDAVEHPAVPRQQLPLSFRPARRFIADSNRSPSTRQHRERLEENEHPRRAPRQVADRGGGRVTKESRSMRQRTPPSPPAHRRPLPGLARTDLRGELVRPNRRPAK